MMQPNILIIQVDELAPQAMPTYGNKTAITPVLNDLGARSMVFDAAYCNYPLCSPSRASMHAGRHAFAMRQWDNGAEFHSEFPTFAHHLKRAGYSTTLCGKMHFIGADQYHGYEERLTTDIYPSDFSWTTDWSNPIRKGGGVRMRNVVDAGPSIRNLQQDFDEEVGFQGVRKIYDLARDPDDRPFLLTVSFTQPHPPFVADQAHWDLYEGVEIDMPRVPPIPYDDLGPFDRAKHIAQGSHLFDLNETRTRDSRRAYYAMMSYIDDRVGELLNALSETGLEQNTVIIFTSDHGEMLGERGMWMKDCFYEWSARVPLFISAPGVAPGRSSAVVSLVDLMPTLLEFAGVDLPVATGQDGDSLVPLLHGQTDGWKDEAIVDYAGSGYPSPSRMVRQGRYKYWLTWGLGPVLFDVVADPDELQNLAGNPEYSELEARLHDRLMQDWNPEAVKTACMESQARRLLLRDVTETAPLYDTWALEIRAGDKDRYVRGRQAAFHRKALQRYPMVDPLPFDFDPEDESLKP
ncbi:MAG: choline-sulfatase [Nioella sp.]|nr:choline-sulfatase [Nioella sp.]